VRVDDIEGLVELLASRAAFGSELLKGLAGSFFSGVGGEDGTFVLAGDPSGNRRPYYMARDDELAFASHPLLCARLFGKAQVDRGLEDFLLVYGFLPDNRTVYRDVRVLGSGKLIRQEDRRWREVGQESPLRAQYSQEVPDSEEELYDRLYEVMRDCVVEQLPACEEVAVLLGGFDSALVAAFLQRLGKRVRTYSFRYAESQYNQPHTDTLSAYLGTEHTWIDITPSVIADGLRNYAKSYVQPTNWLNYVIQTTHLCECIRRDGFEFVYSGDGCDALFLGYPGTYKRTRAFARLPQLPSWLVRVMTAGLGWPILDRKIGHPFRVAMNMIRAAARTMPARAFLTFRTMDEVTVKALRRSPAPRQEEPIESIVRRLAEPYQEHSIQRLGYASKGLVSPNRAKLLACTDVASVCVHSPYMHPSLREFASQIPDRFLREETQSDLRDPGKMCLARMAEKHQLLPASVIYQPKLAAVDGPIDDWLATELRSTVNHLFGGLPFEPDGQHLDAIVETTWAERFYKRHIGSTSVISDAASLLVTYGAMCGACDEGIESESEG
jgi:asparagine synthetase B (glutamine-hydrolysing)